MTIGTIIFIVFWVLVIIAIIKGLRRGMAPPKIEVETREGVADAPRDDVELVIFSPLSKLDRLVSRKIKWLLDGEVNTSNELSTGACSFRTTIGQHRITAKQGISTYNYDIDCPRNGRYEIHLKIDRGRGRLSKDLRIIASYA